MNKRNRILALLLCAALVAALALPVSAARVTGTEAMETLETLGLLRGTGNGFEPERTATRAEAAVMLLRLLGQEAAAEQNAAPCPFTDGGWASAYLGHAFALGLVRGVTETRFGRDEAVNARDYATMALRALDYEEGPDFTWADALTFADSIGLTHGEYTAGGSFLREDLALLSYTALTLKLKNSDLRLIDRLYLNGAVSAERLMQTRLANAVNAAKPVYTAAEIHEMSASAVLYMEVFDTEEDMKAGKNSSTGSAFLISPDGLALLCYHQLEGAGYARATMSDGRVFNIAGVLYYHAERDIAVVRLSTTDIDGRSVRFFPWLDLGDSDALSNGDAVYTVSNPLGLIDSISGGLVSNRNRIVDDPLYPCIQTTAAIASGSSGGAMLNAHGEAVGVIFASFTRGENINLATPINCIRDVDLSGAGVSVFALREIENAKKAAATLTADQTEISMKVGETKDIVVSTDCPGMLGVQYRIDNNWDVVDCEWGDFLTKQSCVLQLTAMESGKTTVTITFSEGYGNKDASLDLHITVTP